MRLPLHVTLTDGTDRTVTTRFPDVVAWEKWSGKAARDLGTDWTAGDLAYLAWRAATVDPRPPFEEWLEKVDDVQAGEPEGLPDPTRPAP